MLTITIANDRLIRMQDAQAGQLLFAYTQDGLLSYFLRDESDRVLQYETSITGKRLSKKFIALDGVTTEYNYGYNAEGLLVTDTTVGQGTVTYTYQQDANGNLTTIRQENFGAGTFWTANTKNELGQTVSFSSPYGLTETTYDANNRLLTQQAYGDTSETITMAYNDHGQVATETFASSGEVVTHTYLANGVKDKEISSVRGVIYERPTISTMSLGDVYLNGTWTVTAPTSTTLLVDAPHTWAVRSNNTVGIRKQTSYNGRTLAQFNCYHFAVKAFPASLSYGNPGFISDVNRDPSASMTNLYQCFVYDMIALGRSYNTTTLTSSFLSSQWKVGLMINVNAGEYHFTRKDSNSLPWMCKTGLGGRIAIYFNGTTPETFPRARIRGVGESYEIQENYYDSGYYYYNISEG